jgi:23S rRNA (cytidine1920-2'-O)/16S rRNA (cytidine1409-2'-O)-methyltransferase
VRARAPFVSRGGLKLEPALRHFQIDATDLTCIDLGASTGGFTDCLLQSGARRVYAFDVGRGQLDWRLRNNPKVEVREGFNVRFISPSDVDEAVQLIVADLSFISLRLIIPRLREFSDASFVLLVKPQFEAEAHEVEKGGLITDPALREEIVTRIRTFAEGEGFLWRGTFLSPVPGQKGNREYFLHLDAAFRRSPHE